MAKSEMKSYKVKAGQVVNLKEGTAKDPEDPPTIVSYKEGETVKMTEKDAQAHATVLELDSDAASSPAKAEKASKKRAPRASKAKKSAAAATESETEKEK